VPDVYAVGDVAAWDGHRNEHWSSASDQASYVAARISGEEPTAMPLHYWWSDQYDVKFQGLGSVVGADDIRVGRWGPAERPIAIYGTQGKIVGVVGLSAAQAVMSLRREISVGAPMDDVSKKFGAR
jgi:3-phenylpropionate/trans-cinnamate dioxygenase ferredoxin reductase subunit